MLTFVHNNSTWSNSGLLVDPHVQHVLNELGGSSGCYAGDESPLSASARRASKKADQATENADGTGRKADMDMARGLHIAAAQAQDNAATRHSSDVASEQHRAAAKEHLEKAMIDNRRMRAEDDDDDDLTGNTAYHGRMTFNEGFADDISGAPPDTMEMIANERRREIVRNARNLGKRRGDATQPFEDDERAGGGPRGGASGRGPNRSQATGDVRPYPGQGDPDEDTDTARRAAEEGRQRNRQYHDFVGDEPEGLLGGQQQTSDGRNLWADDQQGAARYPDSGIDGRGYDDPNGWPAVRQPSVMDDVVQSNASPRLLEALRKSRK